MILIQMVNFVLDDKEGEHKWTFIDGERDQREYYDPLHSLHYYDKKDTIQVEIDAVTLKKKHITHSLFVEIVIESMNLLSVNKQIHTAAFVCVQRGCLIQTLQEIPPMVLYAELLWKLCMQ